MHIRKDRNPNVPECDAKYPSLKSEGYGDRNNPTRFHSVPPDQLVIDTKSGAGGSNQKKINYQKGGGGGAFKRRQGYITGLASTNTNWGVPGTIMKRGATPSEGKDKSFCNINSFSQFPSKKICPALDLAGASIVNPKKDCTGNQAGIEEQKTENGVPQSSRHLRNNSDTVFEKGPRLKKRGSERGIQQEITGLNERPEKEKNNGISIVGAGSFKIQKEAELIAQKNAINTKVTKYTKEIEENSTTRKEEKNASELHSVATLKVEATVSGVGLKSRVDRNGEKKKPSCFAGKERKFINRTAKTMREMKKQILFELMEINKIPASYFILGKDAGKKGVEVGIEEVVDLVEISTNEEGDIVIRPKEALLSNRLALRNNMFARDREEENPEYQHAITVKKIKIIQQSRVHPQTGLKKVTQIEDIRKSHRRQYLTPLRGKKEAKKTNIEADPNVFSATLPLGIPSPAKLKRKANFSPSEHIKNKKHVVIPKIENTPVLSQIKVWHTPDEHHLLHPINTTIKLINDFSAACLRVKPDGNIDKILTLSLSKKLGLNLSKSQINNPDYFKHKENVTALKEKLLKTLYAVINKENEVTPAQINIQGYSRVFVGNGNNPMMVKTIFKQRWWWTTADTMSTAHLVWTQWRKAKFIEALPSLHQSHGANSILGLCGSGTFSSTAKTDSDLNNSEIQKCAQSLNKTSIGDSVADIKAIPISKMCNHVEGNVHLGNKKGLYYNMKWYYEAMKKDPFMAIPLTFHIKDGVKDPQFESFQTSFLGFEEKVKLRQKKKKTDAPESKENAETDIESTVKDNVWIIKPGENSNRGNGITVCKTLSEIKRIVSDCEKGKHTYIIQKYIEMPLLINKRKFDIRCYGLITALNDNVKGYFYKDGYLRTASREFTLKSLTAKIVHLTNEAVQKKYEEFGKFEPGNKMTYAELNKYIETAFPDKKVDFYDQILPQIKKLVTDSIRAAHGKLDPKARQATFELFGYDFMIDSEFHVFLIEANINPCLEIMSPITARIVPAMLDSALRIAVDPLFQPPHELSCSKKTTSSDILPEIRHELVYDSKLDGAELQELGKNREEIIIEVEDEENRESDEEAEAVPPQPIT